MTAVPLRLLKELYWAGKHIDRSRGRDKTIERYNRIRERFNAIARDWDNPVEAAFLVPAKKNAMPHAEVNILPVEGNAGIVGWIERSEASVGNGGYSTPFDTDRLWPTEQLALKTGIGRVLSWTLAQMRRSDMPKSKVPDGERVIAECRKFLNPLPQQANLF